MPSGEAQKANSISRKMLEPALRNGNKIVTYAGGSSNPTTNNSNIYENYYNISELLKYDLISIDNNGYIKRCANNEICIGVVENNYAVNSLCRVLVFGKLTYENIELNKKYFQCNGRLGLVPDYTQNNNIQEIATSLTANMLLFNPQTAYYVM